MLEKLKQKIESIMYAPTCEQDQGALGVVLYGISKIYSGVQVLRREAYLRGLKRTCRLPCKVISVGNLAVGGTGKTPMTAYLAKSLEQMGLRVVVISRGYKGRGGRTSHVVSDGAQVLMETADSGDEAQMLARQLKTIPVLIGKDRYQVGLDAVAQFHPDVIILDDAFQHLRLHRDLNLVLMDDSAPLGNQYLLPRGLLREPIVALRAADGIVFTRAALGDTDARECFDFIPAQIPVFRSIHRPYLAKARICAPADAPEDRDKEARYNFSRIDGARVAAFSGIARNDEFQRTLMACGVDLVKTQTFTDHHTYTLPELSKIASEARDMNVEFLVTTEKDFVRLAPGFNWPRELLVVGIEIDFGEQEATFLKFLHSRLELSN